MRNPALVLVVFCAACGPTTDRIERTDDTIVGGESFSGMPAVGALTYYGGAHCTGALIDTRTVLTAAHCVDGVIPQRMAFVVGANISQAEHIVQVASVEAHPSYNSSTITNDIGLVHLAADAPVAPMPVLGSMGTGFVGKDLFFVGYGVSNGTAQSGAGVKRAVWMSVSQVSATTFAYSDPGKNTCNGDSGGPAFYKDDSGVYWVAGVTSYGDANCTSYGVDTKVSAFLDFVQPSASPSCSVVSAGECAGEVLSFCDGDSEQTVDCESYGKTCGFDSGAGRFDCVAPAGGCGDETYQGRCDGGQVIYCDGGEVHSLDCAGSGAQCGFSDTKGYYDCI